MLSNKDNQYAKKTGSEWAAQMGIKILKSNGWLSEKSYLEDKITKSEFALRCSNSELEKPPVSSRRDISKFKNEFYQKK